MIVFERFVLAGLAWVGLLFAGAMTVLIYQMEDQTLTETFMAGGALVWVWASSIYLIVLALNGLAESVKQSG